MSGNLRECHATVGRRNMWVVPLATAHENTWRTVCAKCTTSASAVTDSQAASRFARRAAGRVLRQEHLARRQPATDRLTRAATAARTTCACSRASRSIRHRVASRLVAPVDAGKATAMSSSQTAEPRTPSTVSSWSGTLVGRSPRTRAFTTRTAFVTTTGSKTSNFGAGTSLLASAPRTCSSGRKRSFAGTASGAGTNTGWVAK